MLNATTNSLPLQDSRKWALIEQGTKFIREILPGKNKGCLAFGDFHAGNVMVPENGRNGVKVYLIDPEYIGEENDACRMQDVATFYVRAALEEYRTTLRFDQTLHDFQIFMQGYEEALRERGGTLNYIYHEVYPKRRFLFHLGLSSLLEALFIFRRFGTASIDPQSTQGEVDLADKLMTELALCLGLTTETWAMI